jgi:hypothetical protein
MSIFVFFFSDIIKKNIKKNLKNPHPRIKHITSRRDSNKHLTFRKRWGFFMVFFMVFLIMSLKKNTKIDMTFFFKSYPAIFKDKSKILRKITDFLGVWIVKIFVDRD